jgi:hypothetical protein
VIAWDGRAGNSPDGRVRAWRKRGGEPDHGPREDHAHHPVMPHVIEPQVEQDKRSLFLTDEIPETYHAHLL